MSDYTNPSDESFTDGVNAVAEAIKDFVGTDRLEVHSMDDLREHFKPTPETLVELGRVVGTPIYRADDVDAGYVRIVYSDGTAQTVKL